MLEASRAGPALALAVPPAEEPQHSRWSSGRGRGGKLWSETGFSQKVCQNSSGGPFWLCCHRWALPQNQMHKERRFRSQICQENTLKTEAVFLSFWRLEGPRAGGWSDRCSLPCHLMAEGQKAEAGSTLSFILDATPPMTEASLLPREQSPENQTQLKATSGAAAQGIHFPIQELWGHIPMTVIASTHIDLSHTGHGTHWKRYTLKHVINKKVF